MQSAKLVTARKLCDLYGFTLDSVYSKVSKKVWQENIHFHKPEKKLFFNIAEIDRWIQGKKPSTQARKAAKEL